MNSHDPARSRRAAEHSSFQSFSFQHFSSTQIPPFPRNPHFPALPSDHRLFQRPSPKKQIPSILPHQNTPNLMRLLVPLLTACIICPVLADVTVTHRFEKSGSYQLAGSPNLPPKILASAGKSLRLEFPGFNADPKPAVQLYQINSARKISIQTPEAVSTAEGSQWTWTPPNTRSTANYEFIFEGEPKQIVFLEIRDATWLKATLETLTNQVTWDAQGLSNDERTALTAHGLRLDRAAKSQKQNIASLQYIPRQGDAARRRVEASLTRERGAFAPVAAIIPCAPSSAR